MEYGAIAAIHPDWNYVSKKIIIINKLILFCFFVFFHIQFDTIGRYSTLSGMLSDALQTAHPIVREGLSSPGQIGSTSSIIYDKGAAVLHMFNATLGQNAFRKSLQDYLQTNAYTTVVTDQLFEQFSNNWPHQRPQPDFPRTFFRSWTYQAGYPYLNITYDSTTRTYSYVQERFILPSSTLQQQQLILPVRPSIDTTYVIPFSYYTSTKSKSQLLQPSTSSIEFLSTKSGQLPAGFASALKANPGFTGYYLINYPQDYWNELSDQLLTNANNVVDSLLVNDRADLMISAYLLARGRLTSYLTPFRLFRYLINDRHYVPWYFYDYSISNLAPRLARTEYRESLNQFELRLSSAHYSGLDFWDDSKGMNYDKQFRQLLITIACRSGNKQCLADAYTKFRAYKQSSSKSLSSSLKPQANRPDPTLLPPNLRSQILCYGLRQSPSDRSDYEFVWNQILSLKNDASTLASTMQSVLIQSISFISDWSILIDYINAGLDETKLTTSQFVSLFNYIITNYAHETNAWHYFVDNYSMLRRKLTSSQVNNILTQFATYAVTNGRRNEIVQFYTSTTGSNGWTTSGQSSALATIDGNIAFMALRKVEIGEWLSQNSVS